MGEFIAAGVEAGLRSWRPWGLKDVPAILLIVVSAGLFAHSGGWLGGLRPIWAVGVVLGLLTYIDRLYGEQFGETPRSFRRWTRLLAAWCLAGLFMGVLGSLFFVVLISTLYAVASAGHGFNAREVVTWAPAIDARGGLVASVVFIIGLLAMGWAAMRVWLASATTVAEGRIAMLSTWPFTRGRVLPMTVARLLLSLPAILLLFLTFHFVRNREFDTVATALIVALAWLPMQAGAEAEYYRRRVLPLVPTQ